jgi:hypothetical protein
MEICMMTLTGVKSKRKRTGMTAKRQAPIEERLAQIPDLYKSIYWRAVEGKSMRASVNAQCLECVGWVRAEVHLCTDLGCPLYSKRPYQRIKHKSDEA